MTMAHQALSFRLDAVRIGRRKAPMETRADRDLLPHAAAEQALSRTAGTACEWLARLASPRLVPARPPEVESFRGPPPSSAFAWTTSPLPASSRSQTPPSGPSCSEDLPSALSSLPPPPWESLVTPDRSLPALLPLLLPPAMPPFWTAAKGSSLSPDTPCPPVHWASLHISYHGHGGSPALGPRLRPQLSTRCPAELCPRAQLPGDSRLGSLSPPSPSRPGRTGMPGGRAPDYPLPARRPYLAAIQRRHADVNHPLQPSDQPPMLPRSYATKAHSPVPPDHQILKLVPTLSSAIPPRSQTQHSGPTLDPSTPNCATIARSQNSCHEQGRVPAVPAWQAKPNIVPGGLPVLMHNNTSLSFNERTSDGRAHV